MEQSEFERVCVCVERKQRSGKSRKPCRRGKLSHSEASLHLYQSPLYQRKTLSVRFGCAKGQRKQSITVMKAHELFTRWKFTPENHSIYKHPPDKLKLYPLGMRHNRAKLYL